MCINFGNVLYPVDIGNFFKYCLCIGSIVKNMVVNKQTRFTAHRLARQLTSSWITSKLFLMYSCRHSKLAISKLTPSKLLYPLLFSIHNS